ncbi:MAG: hypothetical protein KVP17_003561 [Porospora cf. gigantea B]|uniref:uncharacterized protein n=1 Tax=Porospora cf. gigantea B TaxID=2853592 RepID=UPI003571C517|nr:MAG: hypothetical protein KVP17_003561 [Porospora cf. gigantea B]
MTPDETEAEVKKLVKEITNGMHSGENEHWIFAPEAGTAVKRVIFVFGVPMWDGVNSGKCCFTLCPMATRLLKESSKDLNGTAIVVLNPAVSRLEKAKEVSYPGEDAWYSSLDSAVAEDEASILACVEAINPSVDEIMKKFDVEPENTYFVGRKGTGGLAAASALSRPEKFGGVFLLDSPLVNRRKIANGDIPTNKETPVHLILTSDCSKGLMAITEVVLKAKGVPVTHSFKKADSFESEVDVLKEAFLK